MKPGCRCGGFECPQCQAWRSGPTAGIRAAAIEAITQAAAHEHSFPEWLADVLAAAAGQLGSSHELIAGRPGSWEASLVDELVKGTVGYNDEYLPGHAGRGGQE